MQGLLPPTVQVLLTGIKASDLSTLDFNIYPNPASETITLTFKAENPKGMVFTIFDVNGKVILQKELVSVVQGENTINVNLSEIESGSFICRLEGDENSHATQMLLINR